MINKISVSNEQLLDAARTYDEFALCIPWPMIGSVMQKIDL